MNGSDALKIATAALRLVAAYEQRKEVRKLLQKELWDRFNGEDQPALKREVAAMQRSMGAQVAGYRRGLVNACRPAMLSGVDRPGIRNAMTIADAAGLEEVFALVFKAQKSAAASLTSEQAPEL